MNNLRHFRVHSTPGLNGTASFASNGINMNNSGPTFFEFASLHDTSCHSPFKVVSSKCCFCLDIMPDTFGISLVNVIDMNLRGHMFINNIFIPRNLVTHWSPLTIFSEFFSLFKPSVFLGMFHFTKMAFKTSPMVLT